MPDGPVYKHFQENEIVYVQHECLVTYGPSKYQVVGPVNGNPGDDAIYVKAYGTNVDVLTVFWYSELSRTSDEAILKCIQKMTNRINILVNRRLKFENQIS